VYIQVWGIQWVNITLALESEYYLSHQHFSHFVEADYHLYS